MYGKLIVKRSRLYRDSGTNKTVKWQRPYIGITRHLDNGQFNPPSHLSAFAQIIVAGIEIRWQGYRQAVPEVIE